MYHAAIGRKFLTAYNDRHGTTYTPRQFFDEEFCPLFFTPDSFLLHVNNSPFAQAFNQRKRTPLTENILADAANTLHKKIEASSSHPDASILMGAGAAQTGAPTSGQISAGIVPGYTTDDVYCSWFAMALGITVKGGLALLPDNADVLLDMAEGWPLYARHLAQSPGLTDKQIPVWNAWWLCARYDEEFEPGDPLVTLNPAVNKERLQTCSWGTVLYSLSQQHHGRRMNTFVYNHGQMNTTIGMVVLDLPSAWRRFFGPLLEGLPGVACRDLIHLFDTEMGLHAACRQGIIGLRALQPKGLRAYMEKGRLPKAATSEDERFLTYKTYMRWIMAMLNSKDLTNYAREVAGTLRSAAEGKRGLTRSSREVKEVLQSTNRRKFVDGLTELVEKNTNAGATFIALVERVMELPVANFPLFMTLLRFYYVAEDN